MTTVAVEGNRRRGSATTEEIAQCVLDIRSWFERNTPLRGLEGATSVDFQRAEKMMDHEVPRVMKAVLSQVNGSIWIMDKILLSVSRTADIMMQLQGNSNWRHDLFPFAGDETGLLVVSENDWAVHEWDPEDGMGDPVSASLGTFLERYRDELLEHHCEFIPDIGVVEKVSRRK